MNLSRRLLPLVVLSALAAAGCGQKGGAKTGALASVAVAGGGVTVDVVTTSSWNGGFNGVLRVTNDSFSAPITSFEVVFKLSGGAGAANAWNGTISAPDGSGNLTAKSPDYLQFSPVRTGSSWEIGFGGTGTFSGSTIVSLIVNKQVVPLGNTIDTTPPTVAVTASATSFDAAGTLTLDATAADASGVARVDFYDGAKLLGSVSAAPYTWPVDVTATLNGTHSYSARAIDTAGNSAASAAVDVVVSVPSTDTVAPRVALASSAAPLGIGVAVSVTAPMTLTLTSTATDDVGVVRVEFYDGATLVSTDDTAPYQLELSFSSADNGLHSYFARAFDAAGNSTTSASLDVMVAIGTVDREPPTVSLASSATDVTAATTITLTATATDNVGVTRVDFYEGTTLLASDTEAPYELPISLTVANNGTHSYSARAFDAAGNYASSPDVTVNVDIQITGDDFIPPTSSVATSAVNVITASSITLTATASDNVGVTLVGFYENDQLIGTASTAPYTFTIPYTAADNGVHSYDARAFDAADNCGTSARVTVTVAIPDDNNDTEAPTIQSFTVTPTGTVTAAATLTATVLAQDNVGVARVEFYDGTTRVGTATASPFVYTKALTSTDNGTHSYTARVYDAAGNYATSTAVALTVNIQTQQNPGVWRVDSNGRITKNGVHFPVHCGSWFGLQGRYEIASDAQNPRGAPMEQYVGNTFWASNHSRTVMQTMTEIKAKGLNVIRLPVVHQTLNASDPQGKNFLKNYSTIINDPTYPMRNSFEGLQSMIKAADAAGVNILLDIHSCSNYVDWRKGRLDARPPWADAKRENYDYKREEYSCASTNNPSTVKYVHEYNETIWLQDLKALAQLVNDLKVKNVIGIDIYNEPWDYSWEEWKTLTEHAFQTIDAVNPDLLVFMQGISASHGSELGVGSVAQPTPHGTINPNWGENLYEAGTNPPNVPRERLVFSPHTYGPSVAVQPTFLDPSQTACAGLEGDAAAAAKCQIVINPTLLAQGWDEHFGYLRKLGYAVIVGEWGGNLDWPKGKSSTRDQQMWGYLTNTQSDSQWQNAFANYMIANEIESCYWSVNPESGDTGGWYATSYDPVSNTGGWGDWTGFDTRRDALLQKVWTSIP